MSAPFRIERKRVSATDGDTFKDYLDRLMKLIPGEVVGLYLVGSGFIPREHPIGLVIWTVVCLIGVIVVKAYGTADPERGVKPDWVHVLISCISFLIWVYTMGGPFESYGCWIPWLGSLLVLAWTFFIPRFYKGPAQ